MSQEMIDQKRIFLVASNLPDVRVKIVASIEQHFSNTTIFTAQDGSDTLMKIQNVPPHVLIVDPLLTKVNGWNVVTQVLNEKKYKDTGIIILSAIPDQERFTDEVVMGRVQYLDSSEDKVVAKQIAKALNYVAHGEVDEFYLRFLVPGDVLIREGEKAKNVYLLRKGSLRVYLKRENGEVEIGKINVGEFVGEMAYINNQPRSADVIATTDCELIEIPLDHLDVLLFQKPTWAKALMITLSNRVKKANETLEAVQAKKTGST